MDAIPDLRRLGVPTLSRLTLPARYLGGGRVLCNKETRRKSSQRHALFHLQSHRRTQELSSQLFCGLVWLFVLERLANKDDGDSPLGSRDRDSP
jgi:hypothetical protein